MKAFLTLLFLTLASAAFADDAKPNRIERGVNKVEKGVQNTAKRTGNAVERGAKATERGAKRTVDRTENWVKKRVE